MRVISFYTADYLDYAYDLMDELDRLKADYELVETDLSELDWWSRTRYKPQFILDYLRNNDVEGVLWIDADTKLHSLPRVRDPASVGFLFMESGVPHGYMMYIPNNEEGRKFLEDWIERCKDAKFGDHDELTRMFLREEVPKYWRINRKSGEYVNSVTVEKASYKDVTKNVEEYRKYAEESDRLFEAYEKKHGKKMGRYGKIWEE